ncbi:MAG: APC family permease [Proteobacteria bacterium]|nr:APC family permease [Pseudomonadota bacterium]
MGVAGTAPAFSAAATTATLIAAVGILSPASLLYCGLIMFGVTLAFRQLNRVDPNAGASYAWVDRAFGPVLGFLAGWSLLVASALFMVSGTVPAATATLMLFAPRLADDPATVTLIAAGWLLAVSAVVVKGIKPASYTQVVLTTIEVGILIAVIVAAIAAPGRTPAHAFGSGWLALTGFTPQLFATGALTAVFFFWGWDVTLNLNEETRDAAQTPGAGAVLAMVIVLLLFVGFAIATLLVLSDEEIAQAGTNVVLAVADKLFPRPWSYVAVVGVMLSTIGTLETSMLQFTRTMFAKGRDGVLHPRYARLHATWQTPWVASAVITGIGVVLLLASSLLPSVNQIMKDSVNAIGFQAAFYYGLASFACAWNTRGAALRSPATLVTLVIWPVASALFLAFVAIYSIPTFDVVTNLIGIGGIVAGLVPLLLNRVRRNRAAR